MRTSVTVAVPGTCGELIQGWYADWAEPVLVSCPIALYSRVTVELCADPCILIANGSSKFIDYVKSRQAVRLVLNYLGRPDLGAKMSLTSQLLPGRGLASSTADVVGVMAGLAQGLDQPLMATELARLACQIEPSDSTMFRGLALLAYRGSSQACELGSPPPLPLLMLDPGYTVDTLTYNAQLNLAEVRQLAATTQAALELLRQGLNYDDPVAIGAAATLSATGYQAITYSPLLEQARQWAGATSALGIVRAHSGSVMGLLYPLQTDLAEPARWLSARFDGAMIQTHLTSGGYLIMDHVSGVRCQVGMT
jgi:L-threonine kinase